VIGLAMAQTNSQGAYVYRFDPENAGAALVAFVGLAPEDGRPPATFHRDRTTPIVLHGGAWADWRFADLPEFKAGRFEGVVSIPLMDAAVVVGMVNFCRVERIALRPQELSLLLDLSLPLAALLTASALREQLQTTTQRLVDRKLLDRAKGLLQEDLGWSEEQAYMHIRRLSRQQRTPMREIAQRLIQTGKQRLEALA
jgi:GAF domain-containing protein